MINYQLALLIATLGVCYTYILTQTGQIFNPLYNRLYKFFKTDERRMKGKTEHPIFKIVIYCHLCFSGQVAAWLFLILNFNSYFLSFDYKIILTTLLLHIFFTAFTIFMAGVIKGIYTKYIEKS